MHILLLCILRSCVCVSVHLRHTFASSSVLQAVLCARGPIKQCLIGLALPVVFFFFFLSVSVIGQLWHTVFSYLQLMYCTETKGKQAGRIHNLREDDNKHPSRDQIFEPAVLNSSQPSLEQKAVTSLVH